MFQADRPTCIYCGWNPAAPAQERGRKLGNEHLVTGARLMRFALPAVLFGLLAWAIASDAMRPGVEPSAQAWGLAVAIVLALLGPVVFTLQLWRRSRGGVRTRGDGLELPGRGSVPWTGITYAQYEPGLFGEEQSLHAVAQQLPGLWIMRRANAFAMMIVWTYYLLTSATSLLTPWHSRVILHLSNGETVTLRDLEDGRRFASAVQGQILAS